MTFTRLFSVLLATALVFAVIVTLIERRDLWFLTAPMYALFAAANGVVAWKGWPL